MADQLQFRRGTTIENDAFVGADGELTIDTERRTVRVHDGVSVGGHEIVRLPTPTGRGLDLVRINATGTAYESRTPVQVRADIGISPFGADLIGSSAVVEARAMLGATVIGDALFIAADADVARLTLGETGGGMILDRDNVDINGGTIDGVDINGGSIDGVDIGATTPGKVVCTSLDVGFFHAQDQKVVGFSGGAFLSGSWLTRTLNTIISNSIVGANLSNDAITLPAGTFYVEASAPAFFVDKHKTDLYSVTDAVVLLEGTSEYASDHSGDTSQTRSFVSGRFTLTSESSIILRHRCIGNKANNGLGLNSNLATEVYSDIKIWRVA